MMSELESSLCEEILNGYLIETYDGYDIFSVVEIERLMSFVDLGEQIACVTASVRETADSKRSESYELMCVREVRWTIIEPSRETAGAR
jgi:hypothetical protein